MWFCTTCQVWYHYECCKTDFFAKSYRNLEDYLEIPLLKGGPFGLTGTAPLVFSTAKTMQKMQEEGLRDNPRWQEMLDKDFGRSSEGFIKEKVKAGRGPLSSNIKCPRCQVED